LLASNRLYPYPVLSPYSDDYPNSFFRAEVQASLGVNLQIHVSFETDNENLRELIQSGKATYALHIECPSTYFRKLLKFKNSDCDIEIPAKQVDNKVFAIPFILSCQSVDNFCSDSFHPDYNGAVFTVPKAGILAFSKALTIPIEKERDYLQKINSIFTLVKNTDPNAEIIDIDLLDERIKIRLPFNDYVSFNEIQSEPSYHPVLCSMVIFPALVSVLHEVFNKEEGLIDYQDYRWFRALKKQLTHLGCNIEASSEDNDPVELAQRLLGKPLSKGISVLSSPPNAEEDD